MSKNNLGLVLMMTLLSVPAFQNAWGGNRAGGRLIDGVKHTLQKKPKEHHARTRAINDRQKRLSELRAERAKLSRKTDAVIERIVRQKRSIEIRSLRLGKYDNQRVGIRARLVDQANRKALIKSEKRAMDELDRTVREGRLLDLKLDNVNDQIRFEREYVSSDIIEEIHLGEKIIWKNASLKDLRAEADLARNEKALEHISIIESLHSVRDILKKIGLMTDEGAENLEFADQIDIHNKTKEVIATIKELAQADHISPSLKKTLDDIWPDLAIGLKKSFQLRKKRKPPIVDTGELGMLVHENMRTVKFMLDDAALNEFEIALDIMVKSQR